ncbi:unnamed protein product [Clonostachys rosea]|uniref:Uncharacterized protein n=1 Tax=Bionectria ochroleuca TaxID=29856 RepID=A0ABY6UR47_BIOOC|nr:unnamed protein product [Clonostachys rosea]
MVKSSTVTTTWTTTTTTFSTDNGGAHCTNLDSNNSTSAWSNTTSISTTSSCGSVNQSHGSTTLRTVTTMGRVSGSEDPSTFYPPPPTGMKTIPPNDKNMVDELPGNPDYPWGGGSPIHRHQIVDEPKEHDTNSIGARSGAKNWLRGRSIKRLKPHWFETHPNGQDGSRE